MKEYLKPLPEIESLISKCNVADDSLEDNEVPFSTKDWFDQIVGK